MEPAQLTSLQLAVMRSLWSRGEARVTDVHADLSDSHGLATTTVATLLKRLDARGIVEHRSEGRQFVYRACISELEASRSMVAELGDRLFEGDVVRLVAHLLEEHEVRPGDLSRVRKLIDAHERGTGERGAEERGAEK